jgi:hypothetical protein
MILYVMIALAVLFLAIVAIAMREGARGRGYQDSDPDEWLERRAAEDDADTLAMLELHNSRRARQGLAPETLAEYAEGVRRETR